MQTPRKSDEVAAACDGCDVVLSCAGPFLEIGMGPVLGAIAVGAHYLDTSGEQAWVRHLHERVESADRVLVPAFGFDYVPGDIAARLAAEQVEGPLDEIVVAYSVKGVGTSRGTRRTIGHVHRAEAGRLGGRPARPSRFGETTRRVRFPFGERTVVEWGGAEPITVPRHTDVRNVRSYLRAPALAGQGGKPRAGWRRPSSAPCRASARRDRPRQSRRKSRFAVVAEARGPAGEGRAVVDGSDVYGLTAAPARPRRPDADRRRGARLRRARPGRGVRRAHARRTGSSRSSRSLTDVVRSGAYGAGNATAPNLERGRVLCPVLRVAERGRRAGDQRRASPTALRDPRVRRAAPRPVRRQARRQRT